MIVVEASVPDAPTRRSVRAAVRRVSWGWSQSFIVLIAAIGVGVLVYPAAASWFSALSHDTDVDGYVQSVENLPDARAKAMLAQARAYNENLPAGPLRDPYALGADGQQTAIGDGTDAYFDTLAVKGAEAMSQIRIPKIHVNLPVFHGTDEDALARGIGHLYGSALPVGGPGTHSVLTGHNGFVQATLFDGINELVTGDTIIITTLGEHLYYEVDQIITVKPDDTDALRQVPGKDYITLVTCTPTGVNTHRLLVRAERVDAPADANEKAAVADNTDPAGFPWWALILVAVPALTIVIIKPRRTTPKHPPAPARS